MRNSYRGSASGPRPRVVTGSTMQVSTHTATRRTVIPRWYSSRGRTTRTSVTGTSCSVGTQTARGASSGAVDSSRNRPQSLTRLEPTRHIGGSARASSCHADCAAMRVGHGLQGSASRLGSAQPGCVSGRGEARAGEASQVFEQLVLESKVTDLGVRLDPALVVPVAARGARVRIVAGGQPLLGEVPEPQVVGSAGAAHPRGDPARIHCIAENVGPEPGDGCGEGGDEQLAVRIGPPCGVAAPVLAVEAGSSAVVITAAEVDQAMRTVDERGEQVRGDDIDGQNSGPGVDARVVDHRVYPSETVHLVGDAAGLFQVRQVPDDGARSLSKQFAHRIEPAGASSVNDNLVPVVQEGFRGLASQAVG